MDKAYNHSSSEDKIYQAWEDSGLMRADETSDRPPFTIPLPPPNVTGNLHLGHAAMLAIEDILTRYKRMKGHEVLWLPGTDHAAIATENVVIKHHGKTSREQWPSREAFLDDCRAFAGEKHDNIVNQMKKMGSWLDWSREAYTFDDERNQAVNRIFKDLYEDGLIERGHRLINWSVGAQSVLSDDELEWDDVVEPFYYIRCGRFVMGTVRPETKCADSPLVVHPDEEYVELSIVNSQWSIDDTLIIIKRLWDDREKFFKTLNFLDPEADYKVLSTVKGSDLAGEKFSAETYAGERNFYVIADKVIDPEKGAGAMTISASHSADDYDLAKRLGLDETFIQKIDFEGNMTDVAGPEVSGFHVKKARNVSGKLLEEKGLLVGKDTSYSHRVPLCYRSNCVVEPMISPQWFIMVEKEYTHPVDGKTTLKAQMQAAVREDHVQIIPERFDKEYFRWIDNLQDWCISRQIWWGHRIPVWYDEGGGIHLPKERKIRFLRHGQTDSNSSGTYNLPDEPLSDKGRDQAREVAQLLKEKNTTMVISSSAPRAKETAEIIAQELGLEVAEHWDDLVEAKVGAMAGKPVETDRSGRELNSVDIVVSGKGGETADEFQARAARVWEKLKTLETEGDILVVTHGAMTCNLFAYQSGCEAEKLADYRNNTWQKLGNCQYKTHVEFMPPAGKNLRQDEDTLDTWFSSALWPFSTLGWPDVNHPDFKKFYPTDVLETGWDILFFWVARMIMFGRYATGKYPFHTVYLHGMVTDEHGKKMSKSKGNGIDPLEMIAEFGADPVRLALVIGSTPGQKIPIGKNKIKGYRNFVNKLWNATRFVGMQSESLSPPEKGDLGGLNSQTKTPPSLPLSGENTNDLSLADRWILSRLSSVAEEVSDHLENYNISNAGDAIYHFVWGEFCDWYLEASKVEPNIEVLRFALAEILKLTHPLCPFITQQCWQELFGDDCLMELEYPQLDFQNAEAEAQFSTVQNIVNAIRTLRAEKGLNPKDKITAQIKSSDQHLSDAAELIKALANLSELEISSAATKDEHSATTVVDGLEVFVEVPFDAEAEAARSGKQRAELEGKIAAFKGRLSNPSYTEKAPPALVEQTRSELAQAEAELEKLS